jgi:hypothetical protein
MNGWNEKIENSVYLLRSKSGAYRMMHDESSSFYSYWNKIISISTIILVTLTGTSSFSIAFVESGVVYNLIIGGVLYIVAVLAGIKDFLNLTEISNKHKLYSIRFSALYHNIQRQLALEYEDRQDGKDYIGWINSEFDSLLFSNPEIPEKIKLRSLEQFGDILNQDLYNDLNQVCVNPLKDQEMENARENAREHIAIEMGNELVPKKTKRIDYKSRYEIDRYMSLN